MSGAQLTKARERWHNPEAPDQRTPDWVVALAELADTQGLKAAGAMIGRSGSLVSMVLSNAYDGDVDKVRQLVMGALLGAKVDCPGLGAPMSRKDCLDWQDKPNAPTSSLRARMYRACRNNCPHFRKGGTSHEQ